MHLLVNKDLGQLQATKWNIEEKDRLKVKVVFDKLYQFTNCCSFISTKLSQIAKFGRKPIIICFYLEQIGSTENELKVVNNSYC